MTENRSFSTGGRNQARSLGRFAIKAAGTNDSIGLSILNGLKDGVPATVATIEYDPKSIGSDRACCFMPDGEKRYILAPDGLKVGDKIDERP